MANILYFASLRETLDTEREHLLLQGQITTIAELKQELAGRSATWQQAFTSGQPLLVSINQQMAADDSPITDSDEIAFFPPVTGG